MGHIARAQAKDLDNADITEEELRAIAWREPPGWVRPHWYVDEPCPPSLPMHKDRLEWCRFVLGWTLGELAYRLHTHDASVRQWQKGKRFVPNAVAYWLEDKAARALEGRTMPYGWRPKPSQPETAEAY